MFDRSWAIQKLTFQMAYHFPAKNQLPQLLKLIQSLLHNHADKAERGGLLDFPMLHGYLNCEIILNIGYS
jgi:iron-sulfur cluster repair protein YtfE (RIC family)